MYASTAGKHIAAAIGTLKKMSDALLENLSTGMLVAIRKETDAIFGLFQNEGPMLDREHLSSNIEYYNRSLQLYARNSASDCRIIIAVLEHISQSDDTVRQSSDAAKIFFGLMTDIE